METQANKIPKTNKKGTTIERSNPLDSEIPEWLQEFRENLVDDEIPLHGASHASSSHEASLEPITKRREDLGKHNVYTHFPKDRNCEICKRTKITRAPCRRRNGEAVPREACKSSWNPRGNKKSFTLTIPWNLAKFVNISLGIIARLHHTDRRLMVLRKEQCAE